MMRSNTHLFNGLFLTLYVALAWYFTARDLREYSLIYISSFLAVSQNLGAEFSPEVNQYKEKLSSVPSYLDVVGLLNAYDIRNNSLIGKEIDSASNSTEARERIISRVASDLIRRAESEIAAASSSISKQSRHTGSNSASLTPFIRERINDLLKHWSRAERICQLATLKGSGLLCPTSGDTRFIKVAEVIKTVGEPGLLLVPYKNSAKLVYPEIFEIEFCNSAPYPIDFFRTDGAINGKSIQIEQTSNKPGDCSNISLGKKEPDLYVGARPHSGDKALAQIEKASGARTGLTLPSERSERLRICSDNGRIFSQMAAANDLNCKKPIELVKITFRDTGVNRNNYPLRLATYEISDSWISEKTTWNTFSDHARRRDHARSLYGALLNRQYWLDNPDRVPWYSIGVTPCTNDDEFERGVKICSAISRLPHGADPMVYAGETIMSVNDVPVFSTYDVWSALTAIRKVSRLDKPIRIEVESGFREGLLIFNPRAFNRCPFKSGNAVFNSFLRSFTMTLSDFTLCSGTQGAAREACFSDQYEAALKRTQFCPTEDFWGSAAGAVGSFGAMIGKTLVKGLLRGRISRAALAALSSSVGVAAIAALEEYAYAYMTSPPVSPATPLIERAAPSMVVGFMLAFITAH